MSDPDRTGSSAPPAAGATAVLVCEGCGAATTDADRFVRLGDGRRGSLLCPVCLEQRSTRSGRATVGVVVLLLAIGVVLVRNESGVIRIGRGGFDLGIALTTVAAIYLATFIHVLPHEAGHAVVGRLVRFRVPRVSIGVGAPVLERRIGRTWVDLRSFPVCGITFGATDDRRLLRTRLWFFIVGGPLATLACTIATWRLAETQQSDTVRWALSCLTTGGLIVLAGTLVPVRYGRQASDGLALLTTPFLPESRIDEIVETETATELREHMRRQDHDEAVALARRQADEDPADADAHQVLVANLVAAERWPDAAPAIRDHLDRFTPTTEVRAALLNDLAWIGVVAPGVVTLAEADATSAEAVELAPWSHAIAGTRGSVLIESGQVADGVELVRASLLPSHPPAALVATHAYLAIGSARLGNRWAARGHLDEARSAATRTTSAAVAELLRRAIDELAGDEVAAAIRTGWVERPSSTAPSPATAVADPDDPGAITRIAARHPDDLAHLASVARHVATARPDRAGAVVTAGLGTELTDGTDPAAWLSSFATALDAAHRARRTPRR